MLAITVQTNDGQRCFRPSADELAGLVRRIGAEDDRFLVVERIPDLPDVYIQVWHAAGGDYTLEHRDGSAERHFEVRLDGPGQVAQVMTAWARGAAGWGDGLGWASLDMGPAPEPVPPLELAAGARRELEDRLRLSLACGYTDRARLAEEAEEFLVSDGRRPVSRAQAEQLADRLWLERVGEQTGWIGETDPERLARAFAALEAGGITAREDFTCCRSCGEAEIGAAGAADARGFVYFHSQCTESAAAGRGLSLLYGGFDGSPSTTTAIGHEVVAALAAVGLPAVWDGDASHAIEIRPLLWRRRLGG
ncbi:hypothetical protein BX285_5415 [Streptomyces sp. 1114.5]|uniref:DUF6891 domain-containing protein n=1 Tax=unclassified Streptomyces TaxID=2593676 RepID=UPI000BCD8BE9|nr:MULTISPECIES: hypothetical protein [unclassified Streptomyces]RKT11465.1 hypothetical protein BX285_5415 [Streptomyces sp. 1114.5]SOB81151.1 hypothetical protein SAMN06272789_1312 [Streptomyces sp. 1331.2]